MSAPRYVLVAPLFRFASLAGAVTLATTAFVFACSDGSTPDTATAPDGSTGSSGANGDGATTSSGDDDASEPTTDAGSSDATSTKDGNGPGATGAECSFNRDCQAALRCECDEATGCSCQPGVRGTGKNGIDACDSGDQCASSVCVDGPTNGEMICSDECQTPSDCGGKLPRCVPVFGISDPICARNP